MAGKEWHQRVDKLNEDLSVDEKPTVRKLVLEEIVNQVDIDLDDSTIKKEHLLDEFKTSGKGTDGCYIIYTSG